MARKEKFTKSYIDGLELAKDGKQETYMDTVTPGFGIRVGSLSKTFIVMKRLPNGDPKRVTLGKYGALTLEAARKQAQDTLATIYKGVDPIKEKQAIKMANVAEKDLALAKVSQTLQWLFDEYKQKHLIEIKGGSEGTLTSMKDCENMFGERTCQTLIYNDKKKRWENDKVIVLDNWLIRQLRSITKREVLARFEVMEKTRPQKLFGGVLAPMVRTHQIAYKFAQSAFEWNIPRNHLDHDEMLENPFSVLKVYNKWKPVGRRTRIVNFKDPEIFGTWWNAVETYRSVNPVAADYILFSILQAGRSIEMVDMTWDEVNFKEKNVEYDKTKNGDDYIMPLSNMALEILKRRKRDNPKSSNWVWDYPDSKTGHIPFDTKHHFHQLEEMGAVYVSTHDLKRTWASAAASLNKYDSRELDYILKHARSDIGVHYFVTNEILIKQILQEVEDKFINLYEQYLQMPKNTDEVALA